MVDQAEGRSSGAAGGEGKDANDRSWADVVHGP